MALDSRPFRRLAPALGLLLAGCGAAEPPVWTPLAPLLASDEADGVTRLPWRGREIELHASGGDVTLQLPLKRDDWEFAEKQGVWHARLGLDVPHLTRTEGLHLRTPAGDVPRGNKAAVARGEPLEGFAHWQGDLAFGGGEPPAEAVLVCPLLRDVKRGGLARSFTGVGPVLLPGMRARATLPIPSGSALRLCLALEPLLLGQDTRATFRVRVDGEERFAVELVTRDEPELAWHTLVLDAAPRAELVLEVEGDLALAGFLDPTLGPAEIGRPGARPWPKARPDLVVFLADTFRADNLSAYGGSHGVTPALDALAYESLVFREARSVSPWTLPSHATLFSGFFPHQVGIDKEGGAVSPAVEMVAETLARAGYRTAAMTDGGLVSARYGMNQGFGVFYEHRREVSELVAEAREFLAADDGRPVFLFLQSYRVHWPYRTSELARAEHGARLGLTGSAPDLLAAALAEARAQGLAASRLRDLESLRPSAKLAEISAGLRAHYLGGVADLDREFGVFLDQLAAEEFFGHGHFLFTSDHGEAFGEHGALFHMRRLHEEQTRIPLLVRGAGLAPGVVTHPASLADVAPTLIRLAGLAPDPRWPGRSLLELDGDRPTFAFECIDKPDSSVAVVSGARKLIALEEPERVRAGELLEAYELGADPSEARDALAAGASWPAEEFARRRAELLRLLEPLVRGIAAEIDAEKAAELEHLGY